MAEILDIKKTDDYVYDISLDGTVVNALGGNIMKNTDGFNFKLPTSFRYTEEHPYIGKGLNRDVVKGKAYVGVEADVAEFDDLYMRDKMGLGIDEYADATINFSRKNYADLLTGGITKKVGNTIKSRRMSGYIEKFMDSAIDLLLLGRGQEFLESYYDYIDRIYNYRIPLRDIASKGKIKKTLQQYKEDCNTLTKGGTKKSRQAWYELAILNNLRVNLDDTIYYVNTGTKKSHTDVKRITHQFVIVDGAEIELDSKLQRELLKADCERDNLEYKTITSKQKKELLAKHIVREEDEIVLNCKLIPNEIVDASSETFCNDEYEYNVIKYIEQFNSRIKPLLVCFSLDIRDRILITNPNDRQYFTVEESKLVSGFPNRETDQDTYEQLMTLERKEVEYWVSVNEEPPFVKECGIDWEKVKSDYFKIKEEEDNLIFQEENEKYLKALEELTEEDIEAFNVDGIIPKSLTSIVTLNSDMHFYFNKLPNLRPTTGGNIIDDIVLIDNSEREYIKHIENE